MAGVVPGVTRSEGGLRRRENRGSSASGAPRRPGAQRNLRVRRHGREDDVDRSDFPPEFRNDPWSDEKFNVVGAVFQNFIWVAVLLTCLAGGLAAKSYNDGATFFLQKATSDLDSAKVISLEEVQRARNLPPAAQAPETE
ncbi:hypothetical protein HKI87_15g79870 [Chloropicon roscoffensis]|uniref:Cation-transporting P-type ATPase N-terminal domain-containing protein n=1 Tax=Chloropicon roscoffensis TaxID=1461544 RepID=A0AAX4PK65_9CHLO